MASKIDPKRSLVNNADLSNIGYRRRLILRIWLAAGWRLKTTGSWKRGRVGVAIKAIQMDKKRGCVQTVTHCDRIESSGIV